MSEDRSTSRQYTIERVARIVEQLEAIGANDMGDFKRAEAGWFHAACSMLTDWLQDQEAQEHS